MAAPLGLRGDFDAPGLRALAAWLPADRLLFKDDLHPAFSSYDQIFLLAMRFSLRTRPQSTST